MVLLQQVLYGTSFDGYFEEQNQIIKKAQRVVLLSADSTVILYQNGHSITRFIAQQAQKLKGGGFFSIPNPAEIFFSLPYLTEPYLT